MRNIFLQAQPNLYIKRRLQKLFLFRLEKRVSFRRPVGLAVGCKVSMHFMFIRARVEPTSLCRVDQCTRSRRSERTLVLSSSTSYFVFDFMYKKKEISGPAETLHLMEKFLFCPFVIFSFIHNQNS